MPYTNRPSKRASKFTAALLAATMLVSTLPASAEPENRPASCTIPVIAQGEPSNWMIENSLHTIQNYPWYKRHSLYWGYNLNIDILKEYTNLNIQCSQNYDNFSFLSQTDRDYLQYLLEPFIATNVLVREKADKIYGLAPEWDKSILALYRIDPASAKKGYNQILGLVDYLEDATANPLSSSRLESIGRDLYAAVGDTISLWGSKSGAEADKNLKEARALGGFLLGSVYNSLPDQASQDSFKYGQGFAEMTETVKLTSLGFDMVGATTSGILATTGIFTKRLLAWRSRGRGWLPDGASASNPANPANIIEYIPTGSIVKQGSHFNACGPACCCMIIRDRTGKEVNLQDIVDQIAKIQGRKTMRSTGGSIEDVSTALMQNGIKNSFHSDISKSLLNSTLNQGEKVIVRVVTPRGEGHFIIVDGTKTVNGIKYYLTRDSGAPTGARGIKSNLIDSILNNAIILEK